MAKPTIGGLAPRYSFILNPYIDVRLSKCPQCDRATHPRKFALLILIKDYGPLALGKTCRYCSHCELIIAHKDELDAELAATLPRIASEAVGSEYLVIGSMDKKVWKRGLQGGGTSLVATLEQVAPFKKRLDLEVTGGWGRA